MRIFRGPGILLSPVMVKQPAQLPSLFGNALASATTNHCALRDELGAIAYALHEGNAVVEGVKLFSILESEYTLSQQREDILECIERATPQILVHALFRSGRYLKEHERPRLKFGSLREVSDDEIAEMLTEYRTQTAAAKALGVSPETISGRIAQAAEDSALYVFKGTFNRGWPPKKVSDEEILEALIKYGTPNAAAKALDVSKSTISKRISWATQDSALGAFKGKFTRKGPPRKASNDEIVEALIQYDTLTAAAKALGVSSQLVSSRVARAPEDSIFYAFKGTFKWEGFANKASDEEIAAALEIHGTQTAAAKVLGISIGNVSERVSQATEDSALYVFKDTFKRGRPTRKKSDDEIAAALGKHGTQAAAAAALGISQTNISARISQATEGSALYAFKGTFKWEGTKKTSDDEIAAALEIHGTQTAAAKVLGISIGNVSERVSQATEDSALYVFKGTFKRGRRKQ